MIAGDIDNYADLLEQAELNAKNDWEMDFVFDLMNKFDEYGDDTYVSDRFDYGTIPVKRNCSLDYANQLVLARAGAFDQMDPSLLIRSYTNVWRLYTDNLRAPMRDFTRKENAIWYWGSTGTGKSLRAKNEMAVRTNEGKGECYWKMGMNKWWNHYKGQENVIIDDIGKDCISVLHLLRWLNWTPEFVETKGGSLPCMANYFIFTSNYHPREIYGEMGESYNALMDRLSVIEVVKPF